MSEKKKLYSVRVEMDVYVVAKDDDEAVYLAGRAMREEDRGTFEIYPEEVKAGMPIPHKIGISLPWGESLGSRRSWTVARWAAEQTGSADGKR